MSEVHLPHLDDEDDAPEASNESALVPEAAVAPPASADRVAHQRSGFSALRLILEVVLIAMGVFLGLAGEQWRESRTGRENAMASLHRLRSEVATNQASVARVKDYHAALHTDLKAYLERDAKARQGHSPRINGIQAISFEHTAWDLALTTQSLAHIDSDLAFSLSRIYNIQQDVSGLSQGISQAMYVRPPTENLDGFLAALTIYYDDIVIYEPTLLKMYDEILPRLDRAVADEEVK
jgi:hypothetical protein